jgi:tRNA-Thr(GGU) m(6)t(6)A37 methyltransferase TsaA
MSIPLDPIGRVRSPVTDTTLDENWGAVVSEIHLAARFAPGLRGLETFSHALIVFFMDHEFRPEHDLVRRPRGRADMPELGIFAQRGKQRPNPLGVTVVEILDVAGPVLTVRGLDAIDGTPVLDVKPYVPEFDRRNGTRVPEWIEHLMKGYF